MRLYTSPKEMRYKIMVGNFTVWGILLVSLMVSLFYWYQISGLTLKNDTMSAFEQLMLWSVVAIGFLAELVKKVTLSTFRNKKIWIWATAVSILTVMGSFAILDQSRTASLNKGSDSYKTAKKDKAAYKKEMANYASVANKSMESLVALEADNNGKGGSNSARKKSGMSYKQFVSNRTRINQDIQDRRDYEAAKNMYDSASKELNNTSGGAGAEVSNPLFGQIEGVTGFTISAITLTFFLSVTLLLEISAYYIGGEIGEFKNFLRLTEAELLDIKNMSMFGVSMMSINRDNFARIVDAMRDQKEANKMIFNMRVNKVNAKGKTVSAGEVSQNVRKVRTNLAENHKLAKGEYQIAGALDLEGYTLKQLRARRLNVDKSSDRPVCPACSTAFSRIHKQDVFCHREHSQEFNNQLRRLGRARSGGKK